MSPRTCFLTVAAALLVGCPGETSSPPAAGPDASTCAKPCGTSCCKASESCDTSSSTCTCQPQCNQKVCGDDGCGGSCGLCGTGENCNSGGTCDPCQPACSGRQCGANGCGGVCGNCSGGAVCSPIGQCCQPQCAGKACGDNACGGTCGTCAANQRCDATSQCVACTPDCTGRSCGSNGCSGSCGTCQAGSSCTPAGQCCDPQCGTKTCGADACGGSCGTCGTGLSCNAAGHCACAPACSGKSCGPDGCGGSCGTCGSGSTCDAGICKVSGACPSAGGSKTIDQLCQSLDGAFIKYWGFAVQACGVQLPGVEIARLPLVSGTGLTFNTPPPKPSDFNPLVMCSTGLKGTFDYLKAAVAAGRICYDGQAADGCVAAGVAAKATGQVPDKMPTPCQQMFAGHVGQGGSCERQGECVAPLFCRASDGGKASCGGTCTMPLAAGATCNDLDQCAAGTKCEAAGGSRTCTTLPGAGQPCLPSDACADDAWCSASTCAARKTAGDACTQDVECLNGLVCAGTCRLPPGEGEACGGNLPSCTGDCLKCAGSTPTSSGICKKVKVGDPCTEGCADDRALLTCNTGSGTCTVRPQDGAACTVPSAAAANSSLGDCLYADNYCKRSGEGVLTGTCTALPGTGDPCGDVPDLSPLCPADSYCKGSPGNCSLKEAVGATCTLDRQCASDLCTASGCAAKPGAGSPCGLSLSGSYSCTDDAFCDPATPRTCAALKAGGASCTSNSQCLSARCGTDKTCILDCDGKGGISNMAQVNSCLTGMTMVPIYIFVSGMLVFFGRRRSRR